MLKKLSIFFVVFIFLILKTNNVLAEGEFRTEINVDYKIQENGLTTVTNAITLQNLFTDLYATSYTLSLDNIKPQNVHAWQDNKDLAVTFNEEGSKTNIVVSFADTVVGRGKKRVFFVAYDDPSVATKTGEVWEIAIPRLAPDSSFSQYDLTLTTPLAFGQEAYISPNPIKRQTIDSQRIYHFDKAAVSKIGISAAFGQFQVFSFDLTYHLENPLVKTATTEIAIPPDTPLQKMYYENIVPKPDTVKVDADGNWLATYTLSPRERMDISVKGSVQIFSSSRPFDFQKTFDLNSNLLATNFWQKDDPLIKSLALKYSTPRDIYNFVSNYLFYDVGRAKPNVVRLGAIEAFNNPKSAICMEYTDLFIAIARAAGIPAREINGFAYTENPKVQPLSLVSDVLHSWPEYWDKDRGTWVSVDPTWASTTGGVNFFDKLDLRHFAFVIHGKDIQKPYPPGSYKLGARPQKDVYVTFGKLPEIRTDNISISYKKGAFIPFLPQKLTIYIKNNGMSAIYNLEPDMLFDSLPKSLEKVEVLPPYASYSYNVHIPFSFLGSKTPSLITVKALGVETTIKSAKNEVIIYNLASIFSLAIVVSILLLIKIGKIKVNFKIKNPFKNTR